MRELLSGLFSYPFIQRALVADGQRLQAWLFHKVFDIDHAEDIKKAEL